MADSIGTRVARIVAGNVHALLDAIENAHPEAAMSQAIREVDSVIDEVGVSLGRAAANKHLAVTNLAEQNRRHEQLAGDMEFALAQGRDDLAKAAIARQLDIEAQVPVVEQVIANTAAEEKELEGYLTALRAKKREMEDAVRQFVASRSQQSTAGRDGGPALSDRLERAGADFDRILSRQTGIPGLGAGADGETAAKLKELADLARQNRIEERLAAVKARTGGPA
jgi:phage shock protein A